MTLSTELIEELARAHEAQTEAHFALHFANRELVKRGWDDPVYVATRRALENVNIELQKAKWMLGRMNGTYRSFASDLDPAQNLPAVLDLLTRVTTEAGRLAEACREGVVPEVAPLLAVPAEGTEISFVDDVPLVPSIGPIVILQGSNREMGYQYGLQTVEIFGAWIFDHESTRTFDDAETAELRRWERELQQHMPEILDFARGWAEGATAAGVALAYDSVLAIWTGTRPYSQVHRSFAFADAEQGDDKTLAAYLGVGSEVGRGHMAELPDRCSGVCAWGEATVDGRLVAASTTDHDCTFQVTIVAYPDEGNDFIYTPFSVKGSIPVLGDDFLGGHPGMNSKGVAYVHHGGMSGGGEPEDQWGYGVRRGPATFHALQFANTAAEARDIQLSLPVGDVGTILGSAGGQWADSTEGFNFEGREGSPDDPNPVIRTASYDAIGRAHSFLYANNNALSPHSGKLGDPPREGYTYTLAGGWFTFDPKQIYADSEVSTIVRLLSKESEGRNRFHYQAMMAGYGDIDLDYMMRLYRTGGTIPEGDFDEVAARWHAGEQWDCSPAHRSIGNRRPDWRKRPARPRHRWRSCR